jgi:hypothetical protein
LRCAAQSDASICSAPRDRSAEGNPNTGEEFFWIVSKKNQSTDPSPTLEHSVESWADAKTLITIGTDDPFAASWYLTKSRIWPFVAHAGFGPIRLGFVLFVIIVLSVLLSPSTESHFIYTDF